jgi:hypothetical protein
VDEQFQGSDESQCDSASSHMALSGNAISDKIPRQSQKKHEGSDWRIFLTILFWISPLLELAEINQIA